MGAGSDSCCTTCACLLAVSLLLLETFDLTLSLGLVPKLHFLLLLLPTVRTFCRPFFGPFVLLVNVTPTIYHSINPAVAAFQTFIVASELRILVQALLGNI